MHTIKIFVITILFLLLNISGVFAQNLKIAVLNFENNSSREGGKYSQKAADLMMNELAKSGTFTVVERKRLDALIREQDFQQSGNVDPKKAVSIGKMLGVDAVVLGTIEKLGVGKQTTTVGDSTITRYNASVEVNIRVVNVHTGAILFSDSEEASANTKTASVPGYDMGGGPPSVDGPLKTVIQQLSKRFINTTSGGGSIKKKQPSAL